MMKKRINDSTREVTIEAEDLSFLSDREHFTWLQRHLRNNRYKRALKKADYILAADEKVASDIVKYYFIPKSKIKVIRQQQ